MAEFLSRVRGLEEWMPVEVVGGSRFLRAAYGKQILVTKEEENYKSDDRSVEHLLQFNKKYCLDRDRNLQILCVHSGSSTMCNGKFN